MAAEPSWKQFLGVGALLSAFAAFASEETSSTLLMVTGIASVSIMFRYARRMSGLGKEAWMWFASGGAAIISGNLLASLMSETNGSPPFPSVADLVYVSGYICMLVGSLRLVRMRMVKLPATHVIDSLLISASVGSIMWATLLSPYVRDEKFPLTDRLVNAGYSGLTLALSTVIVILIVGPGRRSPSFYFLVGACTTLLVTDLMVTMETAGRYSGDLIPSIAGMSFVLGTVGIMHPSSKVLIDAAARPSRGLRRRRVAVMATPLLVTPGLLVYETSRGLTIDLPVIVTASVVLSGLVVTRLVMLIRSTEQIAARERALHEAGLTLVAATTDKEIYSGAITAAAALMGDDRTTRVSLAAGPEDDLTVAAATGFQAGDAIGTSIDLNDLASPFLKALGERELGYVPASPPVDLPRKAIIGQQSGTVSTAMMPLGTHGEIRGLLIVSSCSEIPQTVLLSLEALSSEVSLAIERELLARDLHRQEDEKRFRTLIERSSDIVCVANRSGDFSFMSPAATRLLGFLEEELATMTASELLHPEDLDLAREAIGSITDSVGSSSSFEARICLADGTYRPFELVASNLTDHPEIGGIVVNARDVTERKSAEEQLAHSEARFRALVQNSSDVVAIANVEGILTYISPSVEKVFQYQPEELLGANIFTLMTPAESEELEQIWESLLENAGEIMATEVRFVDRHHRFRAIDVLVTDLRHEPSVNGLVMNARDVTLSRGLEDDLAYQSQHDTLTGLGNRTMFVDRLTEALTGGEVPIQNLAVLVADLDDFKAINEQLGHSVGDKLLSVTADRLRSCLRTHDVAVRLGSDEFAVLLHHTSSDQEILSVTKRIQTAIAEPVVINGHSIIVTTSIGVAIPRDGTEVLPERLMRNADLALYIAKEKGRGHSQVFDESLRAQVFEHLSLRSALDGAIRNRQLVLHYQPIVSLSTLETVGVEALVRWQHPERGLLMPDEFISLAEESGLVVPLGRWVLEEACQQLRSWQLELGDAAPSSLSVNVAPGQLGADFAGEVLETLDRFGIEPTCLHLEITERTMIEGTNNEETLKELRTAGVMVGVDDFGTGYSALGYLQQFPFDVIKIDKSFVNTLRGPSPDLRLITSIIELAHQMQANPVAEGIETAAQLKILRDLGCVLGQGYFFARPLPVNLMPLVLGENASLYPKRWAMNAAADESEYGPIDLT